MFILQTNRFYCEFSFLLCRILIFSVIFSFLHIFFDSIEIYIPVSNSLSFLYHFLSTFLNSYTAMSPLLFSLKLLHVRKHKKNHSIMTPFYVSKTEICQVLLELLYNEIASYLTNCKLKVFLNYRLQGGSEVKSLAMKHDNLTSISRTHVMK